MPQPIRLREDHGGAYRTLPEKIRTLPDFPGIQVTEDDCPSLSKGSERKVNFENKRFTDSRSILEKG